MFRDLIVALSLLLGAVAVVTAKPLPATEMVRLPGHVLPALEKAVPVEPGSLAEKKSRDSELLTLTLTLKRDDQAGFERYLRDVYDRKSKIYRKFLSQNEIAAKFGPSRKAYSEVLGYLRQHGFALVEGAANRLTLTARATRGHAERMLGVKIADYVIGGHRFIANDADPAVPRVVARHLQTVSGLSNLAKPQPAIIETFQNNLAKAICAVKLYTYLISDRNRKRAEQNKPPLSFPEQEALARKCVASELLRMEHGAIPNQPDPPPPSWLGVDGNGQTIGLIQFDTFQQSDVIDFIDLIGLPRTKINEVTSVHVNGGAPLGSNQNEVLLDIDVVLAIAPGAKIAVYDAPFTGAGSFQALFNAAINDGVDVISNSWAYCEGQTTAADVQSIDAVLAQAAAMGISVFNASGDSGSTCLDGSPNSVAVPASSPNATAVGGTSLTAGDGYTYGSERWWDGVADIPATGRGGFGVSRFFSRPSYQDGFTGTPMRSIPDVVVNADPAHGTMICQASKGGCPADLYYGGTSIAAPAWAAFVALLNQSQGSNLGFLNPLLYPLASQGAFHTATAMGSDFSHVGIGSPKLNIIHMLLTGQTPGALDPTVSLVTPFVDGLSGADLAVSADGTSEASVVVRLLDSLGNTISGKTVALTASPGNNVVIVPASGVSDADHGAVIFKVTNLSAETVTFTATDTTDGIELQQTASLDFLSPPAATAGISASPNNVQANGASTTTITVTLRDTLGRPTPGKQVALTQGNGRSVITVPNSGKTDSNGEIQFTATDLFNEIVTYAAVDVTDGNLPVPGNAVVTFSNSSNLCGAGAPLPVGKNGFSVTPFATGFVARPLSFGGINFGGCPGVSTPAFQGNDVFLSDWTGDVITLPAAGGAVSSANRLANIGPTLGSPAVGKDGKRYYSRAATTGNFTTGAVMEIDPTTGVLVRNIASNVKCPFSLVVDPLSGDLFFDDWCFGAGSEDPAIHRIRNPGSANPTVEVYATLPATPNGKMVFAPDGTLYVVTGYTSAAPTISKVTGTNGPNPPTVTAAPGINSFFWVNIGEVDANGSARSLIVLTGQGLELVEIANPANRTLLATNLGGGETGPDGCLYSPIESTVYKLTGPDGGCNFLPGIAAPSLVLKPSSVAPNPAQGGSQIFTAKLRNVDPLTDHAVFFQISGANAQVKLVRTDADGNASLNYRGVFTGVDTVVATTDIAGTVLSSNLVRFTWDQGQHATFLSLNPSPTGGTLGQPIRVRASLTDISQQPPVPADGQTIVFDLGGVQCAGMTDASGAASCQLVPNAVGMGTLTATFAGTSNWVETTASIGFNVMAPVAPDNRAPNCSAATAQPSALWPPNHQLVRISIAGVVDPDGDPVVIAIRSIRQDEPVNGLGDGDTAPDGFGIGGASAQVRAERAGNRNGRVYRIGFEAGDGRGASCSGAVNVGVPHSQKKTPIDDGPLYDSTVR